MYEQLETKRYFSYIKVVTSHRKGTYLCIYIHVYYVFQMTNFFLSRHVKMVLYTSTQGIWECSCMCMCMYAYVYYVFHMTWRIWVYIHTPRICVLCIPHDVNIFVRVTWRMYMCDLLHSYAWHDAFACVMYDKTHFYVWYDSFPNVTWLVPMFHMTQASDDSAALRELFVTQQPFTNRSFDMTQASIARIHMYIQTYTYGSHYTYTNLHIWNLLYVNERFARLTWLKSQSRVWHDSSLSRSCTFINTNLHIWISLYIYELTHMELIIHKRATSSVDMTRSYFGHDSSSDDSAALRKSLVFANRSRVMSNIATSHVTSPRLRSTSLDPRLPRRAIREGLLSHVKYWNESCDIA